MSYSLLKNKNESSFKVKMPYNAENTVDTISTYFSELIISLDNNLTRPIVIVGVGTDRSTGDSLGPLVGNLLLSKKIEYENGFFIFGSLDDTVHATNLSEKLKEINSRFKNPLIVGIDASLGKSTSVGHVTLAKGPLKPGIGVKKQLPEVGQVHLTGIVNIGGYLEYLVLQNTSLGKVMKMAEIISESIALGIKKIEILKKSALL